MAEDLRIIKTKKNIKTHFVELLNQYKFQDITIKMLTVECQINRSTFYRNYQDKYDLLDEIIKDLLAKYEEAIKPQIITTDFNYHKEEIKKLLQPLINYFERHKDTLLPMSKGMLPVHVFDQMLNIMNEKFMKEIEEFYNVDIKIKTISLYTYLIANNILSTFRWWHEESPELTKHEITDIIIRCIHNGIYISLAEIIKAEMK